MGFQTGSQVDPRLLDYSGYTRGVTQGAAISASALASLGAEVGDAVEKLREKKKEKKQKGFIADSFIKMGNANRALAGDVGMTILGRPSSGLAMGGNVLGQAQSQAAQPIGPQLFDPNMGINMAMQQRSQDMSLLGAQAQADATRSSGLMQGLGSIGAAMITGGCWVAREVYGIENPRWLEFRHWLFTESPSWFKNLYLKYGERFAKFISNKPFIKNTLRS